MMVVPRKRVGRPEQLAHHGESRHCTLVALSSDTLLGDDHVAERLAGGLRLEVR